LLNAAGDSIPRLLITTWFGPALLGFFALGTQALFVPSTFICGAVSKVYYAEAACLRRENPGGLRELYLATARRLVVIAVFPAIIVLFLSPAVIVFLFGSQWRVAGVVAQLLAPAFVLQFTIVPITNFSVIERNDLALIWNAIWFVGLVGGMQVAHRLGFDFLETVGLYSVVLTCAYAIMFLMYLGALRRLSAVRKPGVHQG
jgi:O-antigen/teichoic acid export membrane protein